MDRRHRTPYVLGAALGVATSLAGAWLWRSRRQRHDVARDLCCLTQEALARLGVPADSICLPGNGVQLHAVVAGPEDGPLALLLHGFPECWYSWRHQIPALARAGYRVVAPDQRGYNVSDKPRGVHHYTIDHLTADVAALIQALGRERATLIAHDWGGVVAWRFAMDYPMAVDKLVILNAPHPVAFFRALRSDWAQRLRSWYIFFFRLPWVPEALLTLSPLASARHFFRRTAVRRDAFSDGDLEVMAASLAQPGAMQAMLHWYRAAFRYRPARRAAPVQAPTLLIWAEDDVALGRSLTYDLEQWVPDLRLHYIPDCGHWVQNEAPDEVNEHLLAFVQEAV
jgi:pimeloyl-ACP methyl ester carboxylesterase